MTAPQRDLCGAAVIYKTKFRPRVILRSVAPKNLLYGLSEKILQSFHSLRMTQDWCAKHKYFRTIDAFVRKNGKCWAKRQEFAEKILLKAVDLLYFIVFF